MTQPRTFPNRVKGTQASELIVSFRSARSGRGSPSFVAEVEFSAPVGVTVLFGSSGAGKTTILDCIAGVLRPEKGRIAVGERALFDSERSVDVSVSDRRVGYVFQSLALFPHMSARQNIDYGLTKLAVAERQQRVAEISESFGIRHLLDRRPADISGGERQRVALARTLVTDPCVLLLDEPLSGLDVPTKSRIMEDLRRWNDSHRIPILYVTHDRSEVFALAERVVVLEQGRAIAQGSPFEVLENPRHELVASLAGFENIFDVEVKALHEDHGTMTCAFRGHTAVHLEVPLTARTEVGARTRVAVRAGDILVATTVPQGLSARNVLPGRIVSVERRDVMCVLQVDCGTMFEVHVTPQATESLGLHPGTNVWLVLKTHSCHLLRPAAY